VMFSYGGSYCLHQSGANTRARASAERTQADQVCLSLRHFLLNAKHLRLFFDDILKKEFIMSPSSQTRKRKMTTPGEDRYGF